jgi:hypothetical protein
VLQAAREERVGPRLGATTWRTRTLMARKRKMVGGQSFADEAEELKRSETHW